MEEITLTDKNFSEKVFNSDLPILVDFWADWCLPCRMINSVLEEIGEEFEGKIKIGKLNVDENPLISTIFSIEALPTVILFNKNKITQRFVGVQPKEAFTQAITSLISPDKNGEN